MGITLTVIVITKPKSAEIAKEWVSFINLTCKMFIFSSGYLVL